MERGGEGERVKAFLETLSARNGAFELRTHDLARLEPFMDYRGTSLIRNSPFLGPYSRLMPRALWRS